MEKPEEDITSKQVARAIMKYKPIQDVESKRLLWFLYEDPAYEPYR